MAETQSTVPTTTEATAPTGDIKIFIDAFNKDFDAELKKLVDAQQNYKNVYADAIKITTPKKGPWPNDPKVVTIGDLFKYTFPDIESDKIVVPPSNNLLYDEKERENYRGWSNDIKNSEDEKVKTMYSIISSGIRSNKKIENYQSLKKPGITNPSLWSPGQYYFDVFMRRMLSSSGPLKDPTDANAGKGAFGGNIIEGGGWKNGWLEANGGSASVSNFTKDGEANIGSFDYSHFYEILTEGYVGSGIKYLMEDFTGVNIGFSEYPSTKLPTSFSSLFTQYRNGPLSEFISIENSKIIYKDPKFNIFMGAIIDPSDKEIEINTQKEISELKALTDLTGYKFVGYYLHMLLYKAFIQAGDNYQSVVLPLRNPEPPAPEPEVITKPIVNLPQELGLTFNVEKKDSFIIVGGSMSGVEFTIVPNDGTTYITNEAPINKVDDEDMLSDEYGEEEFVGFEDTSTKIEYSPTIDDKQAVVTDTATLAGPVEITKPKDGSMTISQDGLKRLKKHEGSRATVYDDKTGKGVSSWGEVAGFPTVGVGHLIQNNEKAAFSKFLKPGKMSDNEIDNLLLKDLQERINALNKKLKVKVSQNQFDSLLSMMFNTGGGNKSFLKAISLTNEGKFKDAAAQIKSGPKSSKGVVLAGLERRRNEEAETYLA